METDDSGTTDWGTITGERISVLVCVEGGKRMARYEVIIPSATTSNLPAVGIQYFCSIESASRSSPTDLLLRASTRAFHVGGRLTLFSHSVIIS